MALAPRDVPITREQVYLWLKNWPIVEQANPDLTLEGYIAGQVAGLDLPDPEVDTSAMENWDESTHVARMILADLPSYGFDYAYPDA
jgi:hypothetical protein